MTIDQIIGRAWVFGDNIDTDQIIQGRYLTMLEYHDMAKHAFETVRPDFPNIVEQGDILVAGENFGMGSSREEAPMVLKELGIACVIADSFARIFYRNSFNIGLPALKVDGITSGVTEGNTLMVDLEKGRVENKSTGKVFTSGIIPKRMLEYLRVGGAVEWYKESH